MSGGSGSTWWKWGLPVGFALVITAMILEYIGLHAPVLMGFLLALGGLVTIAGSCEVLILAVVGMAGRLKWNEYVAGTIASLASNVPELVMIAFVVIADVRIAFVVSLLTLHINALVFSIFCILLPKDKIGFAKLPKAISVLGSDMLVCASGLLIALGFLMMFMSFFDLGVHAGEGLGLWDMLVIAAILLGIEVVYITTLVRRFSGTSAETGDKQAEGVVEKSKVSWKKIGFYGFLGALGSLVGGHAVGDFADLLVHFLELQGASEMIGAIVISFLAGTASYIMVTSAHLKGKTELALSNVFGALIQVPFVILPFVLIFAACFAGLGIIPFLPNGGILSIDLETISVILFAFPTLLVMWKSISDDGKVNRLETAIMLGLFGLVIYFLAVHG